ncbi:MAG: flippase-like domain-containing protein, partial [Oscillospiraceae bacterium]|nr:flippase-like domain-containing protein [Oscillospiraceae bacterium]
MEEKKRDKRGFLTMAVTILINLIIIAVIASREFGQDNANVQQISLADIRLGGLLLAFTAFCAAVYMECLKYRKMLMSLEGKDDKRGALEVALLGKYYDNVTPFGAGGQPFQIVYLKKRGVSPGTAGALPIVGFLTQQFAFVVIALVVFITNRSALGDNALIKGSAYVGMFTYMLVPVAIVLFAVAPNFFKKIVGGGTRLLGKLHLLKDAKKTETSVYSALDEYVVSLKSLNSRPHFFLKLLFISILYQLAIMSIPYFVLLAFGGEADWWTVFSTVVYIYAAITIIPTPGNAGAAESYFYIAFSSLEGGSPFWAMLVWRGFVYYSWLLCGIIVLMLQKVRFVKPKKSVPQKGRLNVALFNDIHYPSVDGVVRTVDAYAKGLRSEGNYSLAVVPKMTEGYVDDRGYEVVRTPSLKFMNFSFYVGLPFIPSGLVDKLRTEGVNVIHAHSPFGLGKMAIKLG